jgi:hypothetical protein
LLFHIKNTGNEKGVKQGFRRQSLVMAIDMSSRGQDEKKGMKIEKRRMKPHIGIAKFEKRRHPRFLLHLPIEYDRVNSDLNFSGYTSNASKSGLMVNLPEQMDIGQYLKITLFFSFGSDLDSVKMLSQVVWTDHVGEDGSYRSGVRFVDITSEDMNRLETLLNKLSL